MAAPRMFEHWQSAALQTRILGLIDLLCHTYTPRCVVDLGARGQGCGRIDGAYLRYSQQKCQCRGIAVDCDRDGMEEEHLGFAFICGDFNTDEVRAAANEIGPPDTAFLFHVLLHQLDWKHTLKQWSHVNCICVFGPRWQGSRSLRLLDMGREWFDSELLKKLQGANYPATKRLLDGPHPEQQRELWQWGITGKELEEHLQNLGYRLAARLHFGPHHELDQFEVQGHIALKTEATFSR